MKRRAGTRAASADIIDLTADVPAPDPDEPPLKKFRALFEESDPARQTQTQTQQEGATQTQAGARALLPTLAEEEEESTTQTQTQTQTQSARSQRLKRKGRTAEGDPDADVEMVDSTAPPSKRRAVEGTDAVQPSQAQPPARATSKPPSRPTSKSTETHKKPSGAAPGQPDTDEAFLKAVASTKRGKRAEDTFDREFNNLRISRPELEAAPERDAWAVLDDFGGDDRDERANFMDIVELDVPERTRGPALLRGDEERADWAGRPDFKKFKKVVALIV